MTTNGAITNASSLSRNVDLFFQIGASRGKDITATFVSAFTEDPEVAIRILEYGRDARGGAGERVTFRNLFTRLISIDCAVASRLLVKIPEIGRFDDLFVAFGTPLERAALRIIASALADAKNGLAAKWCPRQGPVANKIRSYLQLTPKAYRQLLVGLSSTVEQQMCAQDWAEIDYNRVPSLAAARYQNAFGRHDPVGYGEYKDKLTTGEAKINASVAYPYDVIRSLTHGDASVANAQWAALPNYLEGSTENILSVVDVSGSMSSARVSGSVTALDVAISLGLYTAERMGGAFKDTFVTFSTRPQFVKVTGNLSARYDTMSRANWTMTTDLQAVFSAILTAATQHSVPESEMPTKLLILSDMEFNSCVAHNGRSVSAMNMIRDQYTAAGYKLPQVVFWCLNARAGNIPVTYNETGTALISGFSPSIMTSVLGGEEMTPISIMLKSVMCQRYDF